MRPGKYVYGYRPLLTSGHCKWDLGSTCTVIDQFCSKHSTIMYFTYIETSIQCVETSKVLYSRCSVNISYILALIIFFQLSDWKIFLGTTKYIVYFHFKYNKRDVNCRSKWFLLVTANTLLMLVSFDQLMFWLSLDRLHSI